MRAEVMRDTVTGLEDDHDVGDCDHDDRDCSSVDWCVLLTELE